MATTTVEIIVMRHENVVCTSLTFMVETPCLQCTSVFRKLLFAYMI